MDLRISHSQRTSGGELASAACLQFQLGRLQIIYGGIWCLGPGHGNTLLLRAVKFRNCTIRTTSLCSCFSFSTQHAQVNGPGSHGQHSAESFSHHGVQSWHVVACVSLARHSTCWRSRGWLKKLLHALVLAFASFVIGAQTPQSFEPQITVAKLTSACGGWLLLRVTR